MFIVVVYGLLFNLYIFELTHLYWDEHYVKLFYNYLTLGMILFYLIDRECGFVGWFHKQFNWMCIISVIINYIIIILNRHGFFDDTAKLVFTFHSSIIVVTVLFIVSGIKHKVFASE